MAVVATKSTLIQNAEAIPPVRNDVVVAGGKDRVVTAVVEVAAGDDDGSLYHLARVKSSDRLIAINLMNDAIGAGTDWDIGLYKWTDGAVGAVQNGNLFADGISMASARTTAGYNALWATLDFGTYLGKRIWQMLGLSADPAVEYVISATANTVGTAAGSIGADVFIARE